MLIFFIVIGGLSLLILGHEAGHFFAAKFFKLKIDEFGFGFPPRIFAKKKGETEYSLNWLPFGGFVRIAGENDHMGDSMPASTPEERARIFSFQLAWRRSIIVLAGVAVNFLLGWIFLSLVFAVGTPPILMVTGIQKDSPADKAGFMENDIITNYSTVRELTPRFSAGAKEPVTFDVLRKAERMTIAVVPGASQSTGMRGLMIYSIQKDSPAIEAGFKEGDIINGFSSLDDFIGFVRAHKGEAISLDVTRGGGQTLTFNPRLRDDVTRGGLGVLLSEGNVLEGAGLLLRESGMRARPLLEAAAAGFKESLYAAKLTFSGFYELIRNLLFRGAILEGVVGPVGIFSFAAEAGRVGLIHLLNLMGIISVNLAVINLIPFPALDGGRFFLILVEKIKGTPISRKTETVINTVGFVFLIFLMVAITVRDVINL